jgi:hypothetical protein
MTMYMCYLTMCVYYFFLTTQFSYNYTGDMFEIEPSEG